MLNPILWPFLSGLLFAPLGSVPQTAVATVCPGVQDSFAQTREAALNEARRDLLLQGSEVWISAQTQTQQARVQNDWLEIFSRGVLRQEQILSERWLPAHAPQPPCFQLHLQALVQNVPHHPDPDFSLRVWLQEKTLSEGQAVEVQILSQSGGYLTLLNVSEDGSVTLLLPNARQPKAWYLAPGQMAVFPAMLAKSDLHLVAHVLPGRAKSQELLKAVLTRTPLRLNRQTFKEGMFRVYDRFGTGLYAELQQVLFALSPGSWAESNFVYTVHRAPSDKK
jgi:hypothetical protein